MEDILHAIQEFKREVLCGQMHNITCIGHNHPTNDTIIVYWTWEPKEKYKQIDKFREYNIKHHFNTGVFEICPPK